MQSIDHKGIILCWRLIGVLFVLLIFFTIGCFSRKVGHDYKPPRVFSATFPISPLTQIFEFHVSRSEYIRSFTESVGTTKLRVVEVARGSKESVRDVPLYRLFDVTADSPAAILGLASGDLLMSANDLVIPNGEIFKQYLNLLAGEKNAEIRFQRNGVEIIHKITFVS
ncbi:MAG TPA: hypothetical protein PKD37_03820 [Oligoflexia bacterium]|nr:hypothetical protein [Oligoflexia bacterium]HMP27095.1 hypothetical protein [Oligoflexia bacterium]